MLQRYCARGVLRHKERVLFIRYEHKGVQSLALPGGGVHVGESLVATIAREFKEETDLVVKPTQLLLLNEFINPNPEHVAESWKEGIHQIESIFWVECDHVNPVRVGQQRDEGMKAVCWMAYEDLIHENYYPPMPARWFYEVGPDTVPRFISKVYPAKSAD